MNRQVLWPSGSNLRVRRAAPAPPDTAFLRKSPRSAPALLSGLLFSFSAAFLVSCGGGGGSGGGSHGELVLEEFLLGRGVNAGRETAGGLALVSPLTFADVDRKTGWADPASVRPIGSGIDASKLVSFALDESYGPPVVPRNGILLLRFSDSLDPATVTADKITPAGSLVSPGSVQVRDQADRPVPVKLVVQGRDLLINPMIRGQVGFPASPFVVDAQGDPITDPEGYLHVQFAFHEGLRVRSMRGRPLRLRQDRLGETDRPLGFNPGNAALDFIEQNRYYPTEERYNGNLPDDVPPRLVRRYVFEASLDLASGDSSDPYSLTDLDAGFSARARGGSGEWAGAALVIRPGETDEETLWVSSNSEVTVNLQGPMSRPLQDGEDYRLERDELYEPDPHDPIDPENFDPFDPENGSNSDLRNFLLIRRLDAKGRPEGELLSPFEPIPSRSEIALRFTEPMDQDSVLAFENLTVTEPSASGRSLVKMGEITTSEQQTVVHFRPIYRDPSGNGPTVVGFGPNAGNITLSLITVPSIPDLMGRYNDSIVAAILAEGWRPLKDLGGQSLAFPPDSFDPNRAHIRYETVLERIADATLPDLGVIVHRFRGKPRVSVDPESGKPGVTFRDVEGFYGPRIADINLSLNGFLSGSPAKFFQKVHDDENPPDDLKMDPWPFGAGTPLAAYVKGKKTFAGIYGARFQGLYRNKDCSPVPGVDGLALDLWRLSWCPSGGTVEFPADVFQNISIDVYHSHRNPGLNQSKGGLGRAFDPESYQNSVCTDNQADGPNWDRDGTERRVVPPFTTYTISRSNLFKPATSSRNYEPWPEFNKLFAYDNTRSMVVEYRIRPQQPLVSFRNSFTFTLPSVNKGTPRFRVFSLGDLNNTLQPDSGSDKRALCAQGPQGGSAKFGDNMIYFMVFDYVKSVSAIDSPFIGVDPDGLTSVTWWNPIIEPAIADQSLGTQTAMKFQGAVTSEGGNPSTWVEDLTLLAGYPYIRFRMRLTANPKTQHVPTFDLVVLPYLRD